MLCTGPRRPYLCGSPQVVHRRSGPLRSATTYAGLPLLPGPEPGLLLLPGPEPGLPLLPGPEPEPGPPLPPGHEPEPGPLLPRDTIL